MLRRGVKNMTEKKWSNPKGKKLKQSKPKYAMFNRYDSLTQCNEYILYNSNFKVIGVTYKKPKKVKFVSPSEVFTKTKGSMGR